MSHETIGVFDAKTHLSSLLEQVRQGKSFVITRHGKPVAELRPVEEAGPRPLRGCAHSRHFHMVVDFDAPLDDFADYS